MYYPGCDREGTIDGRCAANFIDGKWVDALHGARFDVFNPASGEVIATAPDPKHDFLEKKSVSLNPS